MIKSALSVARLMIAAFIAAMMLATPALAQELPANLAKIAKSAEQRGAFLGNPNGKTLMFEFFDYNCPYCRSSYPVLMQLVKEHPDLKIVLVEFPALGGRSREASQHALQLSGEAYVKVYSTIMSSGGQVNGERIIKEAQALGATVVPIDPENPDADAASEIDSNSLAARSLGFNGVPGFYVNGKTLNGFKEASIIKLVCGYTSPGSCSSYQVLLDDASAASRYGSRANMERFLAMAVADVKRVNTRGSYNTVCWDGAMMDGAGIVMEICNAVVDSDPENASYRDSRGLARALTGDKAGAIADFTFFVEKKTVPGQADSKSVVARRSAIERLKSTAPISNAGMIALVKG